VTWVVGDDGDGLGKAAAPLLLILLLVILAVPYLAVMILRFMPKSLVRTHLYSGGIVQTVNGRVHFARWEDIRSIEAESHRASVTGCRIIGDGPEPLRIRADREPIGYELRFRKCQRPLRCPGGWPLGVQAGGHQKPRCVASGVPGGGGQCKGTTPLPARASARRCESPVVVTR
jgi:hypothetical protein